MELKTKLIILGIVVLLVTTGFSIALVWMTKVVETKALAKKAAAQEKDSPANESEIESE